MNRFQGIAKAVGNALRSDIAADAFDAALDRVFPVLVTEFFGSAEKRNPKVAATLRKIVADPRFIQAVTKTV